MNKKKLIYLLIVLLLFIVILMVSHPLTPAHGGIDGGACTDQLMEKDVNLAVALKLRNHLIKKGFRVVMTREADVSLDYLIIAARADTDGT